MPLGAPRPQASVATVILVPVSTRTTRSASVTSALVPVSRAKPLGADSPRGERTSNDSGVACTTLPDVPVMVSGVVPGGVAAPLVIDSIAIEPGATLAGTNVAEAPA